MKKTFRLFYIVIVNENSDRSRFEILQSRAVFTVSMHTTGEKNALTEIFSLRLMGSKYTALILGVGL